MSVITGSELTISVDNDKTGWHIVSSIQLDQTDILVLETQQGIQKYPLKLYFNASIIEQSDC